MLPLQVAADAGTCGHARRDRAFPRCIHHVRSRDRTSPL